MNNDNILWNNVSNGITFQAPVEFDKITELLPSTSSILDYGCGYGRISKTLKEIGFNDIVGYDSAEMMIERARKENPEIRFVILNDTIPEECNHYDGIICSALFTCIPNDIDKIKVSSQ